MSLATIVAQLTDQDTTLQAAASSLIAIAEEGPFARGIALIYGERGDADNDDDYYLPTPAPTGIAFNKGIAAVDDVFLFTLVEGVGALSSPSATIDGSAVTISLTRTLQPGTYFFLLQFPTLTVGQHTIAITNGSVTRTAQLMFAASGGGREGSLPYPGGVAGATYAANPTGLGLAGNQNCPAPAPGGGVLVITSSRTLFHVSPIDESGTVASLNAAIFAAHPTLVPGGTTHILGVASDLANGGNLVWVLAQRTSGSAFGQYVLSSPDLVTWTLVRTIVDGGLTPTTLALGIGNGGAVLIGTNYGGIPGGGRGPYDINPADDPMGWSYAIGTAAPVALAQGPGYAGRLFYNLGFFQPGAGTSGGDLWYGVSAPTGTGNQTNAGAYNFDINHLWCRFGGGPKAPLLIHQGQSSNGAPYTLPYLAPATVIDAAGGVDTAIATLATDTYAPGGLLGVMDDGAGGLYGIDHAGTLLHRAGIVGTGWATLHAGFIPANNLVVLLDNSILVPGAIVCVHGSNQVGALAATYWQGGSVVVGDYYFGDFSNTDGIELPAADVISYTSAAESGPHA